MIDSHAISLFSEHRAYELQEPCSTFYTPQNKGALISRLDKMTHEVKAELTNQGFEDSRVHVERMLNMRFEGTDTALMVLPNDQDSDGKEDFEAAFNRAYKSEFGFLLDTKSIIVDDIKVRVLLSVYSFRSLIAIHVFLGPWNRKDFRHTWRVRLCGSGKAYDTTRGYPGEGRCEA